MAKTTEKNKGFFGLGLDQSGSMAAHAESVARIADRTLLEFMLALPHANGVVRDLFQVSVTGFGGHGVASAIRSGPLAGLEVIGLRELEQHPTDIRPAPPGSDECDLPSWVEPLAQGGTPLREWIERMDEIVTHHSQTYPDTEKPVIALLSDGQPTTTSGADILPAAESLRSKAMLLTCYFEPSGSQTILFPSNPDDLRDQHAKLLFEASSEIPPEAFSAVEQLLPSDAPRLRSGARGLVCGSVLPDITRFFQFASAITRTSP